MHRTLKWRWKTKSWPNRLKSELRRRFLGGFTKDSIQTKSYKNEACIGTDMLMQAFFILIETDLKRHCRLTPSLAVEDVLYKQHLCYNEIAR